MNHSCSSWSAKCGAWKYILCCSLHAHMMVGFVWAGWTGDMEQWFSVKPCPEPEDILLSMQLHLHELSAVEHRAGCPACSSSSGAAQPTMCYAITQSRNATTSEEVSPGDLQKMEFVLHFLFGESSVLFHTEGLQTPSHHSAAGSPNPKHKLVSFTPKLP